MPEIIENWDNYADLISDNYPWYGSQIDWDKMPNHLSMKLGSKDNIGESLIKFINENKLDHLFKADKYLIYINDSSLDYGIKFNSEIYSTLMKELIELIPQHHYFFNEDASWCLVISAEGYIDFGKAAQHS